MSEMTEYSSLKAGPDRQFGLVIAGVFVLIAAVSWYLNGDAWQWAGGVATPFIIFAIFRPSMLHPLNILWFKFGLALGRIITPIVMTILFYLVVSPISLLMRATGGDPMRLKRNKPVSSYWIKRDPNKHGSMKDPF